MMGDLMWGNGMIWLLVVVVIVFAAATLIQYLCSMSSMRTNVLKRSLIALLILALTSAWHAVPSCAAQPCDTDNTFALVASHSSIDSDCKSIAGDCTVATICCQISPNLLAPYVPNAIPINWDRVAYPYDFQALVGLRLKPDLHPPTTRI
jgi:hypothetical protein